MNALLRMVCNHLLRLNTLTSNCDLITRRSHIFCAPVYDVAQCIYNKECDFFFIHKFICSILFYSSDSLQYLREKFDELLNECEYVYAKVVIVLLCFVLSVGKRKLSTVVY